MLLLPGFHTAPPYDCQLLDKKSDVKRVDDRDCEVISLGPAGSQPFTSMLQGFGNDLGRAPGRHTKETCV